MALSRSMASELELTTCTVTAMPGPAISPGKRASVLTARTSVTCTETPASGRAGAVSGAACRVTGVADGTTSWILPRLGGATGVFGGGRSVLLVGAGRDDVSGVEEAGASGVFFDVVAAGASDVAVRRGAVVDRGAVASARAEVVGRVVDVTVLDGVDSDVVELRDAVVVPVVADVSDDVPRTDGPAEASAPAAGSGVDVQPATTMVTTAARAAATARRCGTRRAGSWEMR